MQGILVDGEFTRLKETLMTSYPELEVRHTERKSDAGWTEKQALESALLEDPITVFMYCLHVMRANVKDAFPPTVLATVVQPETVSTEVGGDTVVVGGVEDKVGGVDEEEEQEEEEEEESDENVEDNAITIDQISQWLSVSIYSSSIHQ